MTSLDIATLETISNSGDTTHNIRERKQMKLPLVEGQPLHSSVPVYVGSISVSDLVHYKDVPYLRTIQKDGSFRKVGYQRKPQEVRISRFATALKKGTVDVAPSILLNIRDVEVSDVIKHEDGGIFLVVDPSNRKFKLSVVDGQHRVEAFEKLLNDDREDPEKWGTHKLQFVLMVGAAEREEMHQFYVVNTEAKSVRTDLALDLLKQRSDTDGRILNEIIERGQEWKVDGQGLTESLQTASPVWRGMIRLANAEKASTVIPAASFVSSLRMLLTNSPFFKTLNHEQRLKILNAYWRGIRKSLPLAFDQDPDQYSLQKGIGVTALHDLLLSVIEIVRNSGESVFDEDAYATIMLPVLDRLAGDNVDGENVDGAEFWLNQKLGGAAGAYSSSSGRRVLIAKLRALLPDVDVK